MGATGPDRGVVLAGGESRRFEGGEKALATVGDRPILARSVAAARTVSDGVPMLALASSAQRATYERVLDGPVEYVVDAPGPDGPVAGLRSATDGAAATWLFVLGCDMPLVEPRAIDWLADHRDGADAVVPRTADGIHPLHAWYRRAAVSSALAATPEIRSLHALLDRLDATVVDAADAPAAVSVERSVCNVNTRADLADARRRLDGR